MNPATISRSGRLVRALPGLLLALGLSAATLAAEESAGDLFAGIDDTPAATADAPAAAGAGADAALAGGTLKLAGTHKASLPVPVDPDNFNYANEAKKPRLSNTLGLDYSAGEIHLLSEWHLDLAGDLGGLASAAGSGSSAGWPNAWDSFLRLRPGENYIAWNPAGFRLSLGYQLYSWGSADGQNPTDHLNARDYAAGLGGSRIPLLSAAASWYPADYLSVDGVFAPLAPTDSYPVDFASQIPATLFYGQGTTTPDMVHFSQVPVVYARSVSFGNPSQDLSSFVAGGKVNLRSSAVDVAVSYQYDLDAYYTPVITLSLDPIQINGVIPSGRYFARVKDISLQRLRMHRIGLDLKANVDRFGIWLENAWNMTEGWSADCATIRSPNLGNVLGVDFNWGPNEKYYFNFQMMSDWIPWFYKGGSAIDQTRIGDPAYMKAYYARQLVQGLGAQDAEWTLGWSLALKFPLEDGRLTPTVAAAYTLPVVYDSAVGTRYGSLVIKPEIDLMPADAFHIVIGAQLQYAWIQAAGSGSVTLDRSVDKIGRYTKDNQVYLQFVYDWNQTLSK